MGEVCVLRVRSVFCRRGLCFVGEVCVLWVRSVFVGGSVFCGLSLYFVGGQVCILLMGGVCILWVGGMSILCIGRVCMCGLVGSEFCWWDLCFVGDPGSNPSAN